MSKYLIKDIIDLFGGKIKGDDTFCHNLWSSLANVTWVNKKEKSYYEFSFRYAGAIVADIRGEGSYMDWYNQSTSGIVDKGIERGLNELGWTYTLEGEENAKN